MQISMYHISACERMFDLKFEGSLFEHQSYYKQNFKFLAVQEPSFLIPQICPKSAVNWVLYVYRPSKRFCTLLGFDFGVM